MIVPGRDLMPVVRAALARGQRVRLTANGGSMLPFVRDRDVVELEPLRCAPQLGDVVLAEEAGGRYVVHRVVRVRGETLLLRGDAQRQCEGPFASDAVLGRVTTVWHDGCARNLERGLWRLAGLVWIRCTPLGLGLLWLITRIRRSGGRVIRRLQRLPLYRAWAKRFCPDYVIQEASRSDLMAVYAWLNPNGGQALPASERNANPNLTSYVAKSGEEVLGLVRLMRHPEADFPRIGYWLYSLTVRTRYRGMGVGAALTRRVIDQAKAEGQLELFLCVSEDSTPAIALYRKLGFEPVMVLALETELAADVQKYGRQRLALRKELA